MLIPEEVIKKEKRFVEQEEWRARPKGKYIPFARGVSSAKLKVPRGKKNPSGGKKKKKEV